MTHSTQLRFARIAAGGILTRIQVERVLEIGSADINGSVRSVFKSSSPSLSYCGVDVTPGPGVDKVASGHLLDFPSSHFDVVMSFECFEHNPFWRETFVNMVRMCRPGGAVIVSCAAPGRMEHGTTRSTPSDSLSVGLGWDYYKNISPKELIGALNIAANFDYVLTQLDRRSCDLYFFGHKTGQGDPSCFAEWFGQHGNFFRRAEADWPTVILNIAFSYLEQLGLSKTPWLRFNFVQVLKSLKRNLINVPKPPQDI